MNINLPYVEGTSEKIGQVLGSHKIRSTFYTFRKLHCKAKDQVAREDKSNIVYEIVNYGKVNFSESKRSLTSCSKERKISVRNFFSVYVSVALTRVCRPKKLQYLIIIILWYLEFS